MAYYNSIPVTIDPSTPDYTVSSDTVTYNGVTYDAVNVANSNNANGGVSNGNGRVNVTFDLDDTRPFCFEIHHTSFDLSTLNIRVTIGGTVRTYTDSPSSIGDWLSNNRHYIGYADWYTSAQALNNANDWIQSNTTINVQIQDSYGLVPDNVTLKIVFKPNTA